MINLFNLFSLTCDAPRPWEVYFQDNVSPQMEALIELHDNIMFYLFIIFFGLAWILISIIRNYVYSKSPISNKYLKHGTLIELIWTIVPALILILIAFPSFKLLYLMDEATDPYLTVFVDGHQWYWSYQYPDFLNNDDEDLEFDSYLVDYSDQLFSLSNTSGHGNEVSDKLKIDNFLNPDTNDLNLLYKWKTGHFFIYDQLDSTGSNLSRLLQGRNVSLETYEGSRGYSLRINGSTNYIRADGSIDARLVALNADVDAVESTGSRILSRGTRILTDDTNSRNSSNRAFLVKQAQ